MRNICLSAAVYVHRPNLNTLFGYLEDIHKANYAINPCKPFPTNDWAKNIYLASVDVSEKWTMPLRN